jgi:hypothetical protein
MPKLVVTGAKLECSEGLAPTTLTVLPTAVIGVFEAADLRARGMLQATFDAEWKAWTDGGFLTPKPVEPWGRLPWREAPYEKWYPADWALEDVNDPNVPGLTTVPIWKPTRNPLSATLLDPKP